MKSNKTLVKASSGCCLVLPFLCMAAAAEDLPVDFSSIPPGEPQYPTVGLYAPIQAADKALLEDSFLPISAVEIDSSDQILVVAEKEGYLYWQESTVVENKVSLIGMEMTVTESSIDSSPQFSVEPEYPIVGLSTPVEDDATAYLEDSFTPVSAVEIDSSEQTLLVAEQEFFTQQRESTAIVNTMSLSGASITDSASSSIALETLYVSPQAEDEDRSLSALVKITEDSQHATGFGTWLLPADTATDTFNFTETIGQSDRSRLLQSHNAINHLSLDTATVEWSSDRVLSVGDGAESWNIVAEQVFTTTIVEPALEGAEPQPDNLSNLSDSSVLLPIDVSGLTDSESAASLRLDSSNAALDFLLVGLLTNERTVIEATLIKGKENGEGAVAFDQWLIPFEDAMTALGIRVTAQPDGQLMLESPAISTMIAPDILSPDPDLGLALSIADIEERLGISSDFSLADYAIRFYPPAIDPSLSWQNNTESARPVVLEGLPLIEPAVLGLSGVRQAVRVNASDSGVNTPIGQLSAVGTALDGSWYAQLQQRSITDYRSWQLLELQYLRQSDESDYVLGSQPTFWQNLSPDQNLSGTFWGASTTQRWGFTPSSRDSQSGFSPSRRLQADRVGRTVVGEAAPGTLVQLRRGLSGPIIEESIVDSSGIYRFEDVPTVGDLSQYYSERGYQIQLYADGLRTSTPEIRPAVFTSLRGQLPQGAGALIASVGARHQLQPRQMLGSFNQLQGGIAYRHGISESLTLGTGVVQTGTTQALAEAFYLPESVPLQAALSAAIDVSTGDTRLNADVRYRPFEDLKVAFLSDRFSQRLNADWRLSPNFEMIARGDTREQALAIGARAHYRTDDWSGSASASFDTQQNLRWAVNAHMGRLKFANRGDEISTFSEMVYRVSPTVSENDRYIGNIDLVLDYTTQNFRENQIALSSGQLATVQSRYSSPRFSDGRLQWSASAGYGIGSRGAGPLASASVSIAPGLELEMGYQGISTVSDRDSFRLSLVSRVRPQRLSQGLGMEDRLSWAERQQQNRLRTQGGLLFQPFLDNNNNGVLDADESLYLDEPELLFQVNHETIGDHRIATYSDGILLSLSPDTYRVDLDPAGIPLDRTLQEWAYAARVVPGHYTRVPVPLTLSYTVSGVVRDAAGNAVVGAKVEALSSNGHRQMSITNGAGVYYLERLQPEAYELKVNGNLIETNPLVLEGEDELFREQEIHLM